MEYCIRPIGAADYAAVDRLAASIHPPANPDVRKGGRLAHARWDMDMLLKKARILVAASGDEIFGATLYHPPGTLDTPIFKPDWGVMRYLMVAPQTRGGGIGAALTTACLERAKDDGATALALHVLHHNAPAIRLYEKLGFTLQYDGPALDGVKGHIYAKQVG